MEQFWDFLNRPFRGDMPAAQWFAFIGLLFACVLVWGTIVNAVKEA